MNRSIFKIKLPISHCLYRGAYSGLCCGNVYRDKSNDGTTDRYDIGDSGFPVIHGHTYEITLTVFSEEPLTESSYRETERLFNQYFADYKDVMILTPDNPLTKVYEGAKKNKLVIWPENPTAEYMAFYWYNVFKSKLGEDLALEVEETSHNSVTYTNEGYTIKTFFELPIAVSLPYEKGEIPTLTGANYMVNVLITSNTLDENGMVIDFKKMKKVLHTYLDQYDHSLILEKSNPLVEKYRENLEANKIDFERSRVFVWDSEPSIRTIKQKFCADIFDIFKKEGLNMSRLTVNVDNGL